MKAFLESLDASFDEDEEESDASSENIGNPQREFFGNSGFDSQEYFPELEDLRIIDFDSKISRVPYYRFPQNLFKDFKILSMLYCWKIYLIFCSEFSYCRFTQDFVHTLLLKNLLNILPRFHDFPC